MSDLTFQGVLAHGYGQNMVTELAGDTLMLEGEVEFYNCGPQAQAKLGAVGLRLTNQWSIMDLQGPLGISLRSVANSLCHTTMPFITSKNSPQALRGT